VSERFISDETLMGYSLGALDGDEQQQVIRALQQDRYLRLRLKSLSTLADSLAGDQEKFEPPQSMVQKVMASVDSDRGEDSTEALAEGCELTASDKRGVAISPAGDGPTAGGIRLLDLAFLSGAAVLLAAIVGPAILRSRESSRIQRCAAGLAQLGQSIHDFAFRQRDQRIPEIPIVGPMAFAGVYAIRLNDAELLPDRSVLWCPSQQSQRKVSMAFSDRELPSAESFERLPAVEREAWQHVAGGSYAYNLGTVLNHQYSMPTLDDQTNLALLGDAPLPDEEGKPSFNTHQGESCNVLYEDGRVELLRLMETIDLPDHPYLNQRQEMEAGLAPNDSALGASFLSPLGTPP
jgi:hypothetical protein